MVTSYSQRILSHLSHKRYQPQPTQQLAKELAIADDQFDAFQHAVQQLIDEGQVVLSVSGAVALPPPGREMVGCFRLNERGFGFLVPDLPTQHGDLFIPAGMNDGAMTGDRVRAIVNHDQRRGASRQRSPYVGRIVEILQRSDRRYVGNLLNRGARWVVEVDAAVLHDPVVIRDPHAKNAQAGDKVVIELIEYPKDDKPAQGVITEVLGEKGQPAVETLAVMRAYNLAEDFSDDVLGQARSAARDFDPDTHRSSRIDLTDRFICTIDPPDAKDFDDAISLDSLSPDTEPDGACYELGVHIADVSHFVPLESEIDSEAAARGNSVYLPRKVVPMLPEVLSNGVCSLQEGVERYCKSAFIRFDESGRPVGERFANTIIKSAKRLTYLEAQALIEGDLRAARQHKQSQTGYPKPLIGLLKHMDTLAKRLRQRRLKQGMIVLALPEVELLFDPSGRVVDAVPEDDAFTHTIIEMFMVEANEAAARLFDRLRTPMIRRIHPDPDAYDIKDLRQFARVAGYNIPMRPTRTELQALLDAVRGKPAQHAVHLAVLKTLSKAEYAPSLVGHFALASDHYTHFTSPIRRYSDLIVHRALAAYLEHAGNGKPIRGDRRRTAIGRQLRGDPRCPDEPTLLEIARHCSTTERNAEAAERNLRNYLVLELLSGCIGDEFEGTVTGVTANGIFVQIDRYLVDGFIRIADLPGAGATGPDRWRLNRTTGALTAQRSGRSVTIGARFTVRIANVNPSGRKLDLVIVEARAVKSAKRRQPPGARQSHQKTQKLKQSKRNRRKPRR